MKLSTVLTKRHLRNWRHYLVVARIACYFYSASWLSIEILSYFVPSFEIWSRGNVGLLTGIFIIGLVPAGLGRYLWVCKGLLTVSHRLFDTDVIIEIRVTDIFSLTGAYIISTNTTFDTEIATGPISEASLQGQFTRKYYDKIEHLDDDLTEALKGEQSTVDESKPRKKICYDLGTVAKIRPREQLAYFVAIAELNEHGTASSSLDNVRESLNKLWTYIRYQGEFEPLVIPVLGTGRARIHVPRQVMVKEIIRSFVNARYSGNKFCEKLTIAILDEDYRKQDIDLQELLDYIRVHSEYERWQGSDNKTPVGKMV